MPAFFVLYYLIRLNYAFDALYLHAFRDLNLIIIFVDLITVWLGVLHWLNPLRLKPIARTSKGLPGRVPRLRSSAGVKLIAELLFGIEAETSGDPNSVVFSNGYRKWTSYRYINILIGSIFQFPVLFHV